MKIGDKNIHTSFHTMAKSDDNAKLFTERADTIISHYGHIVDFEDESNRDILPDMIESFEDLERIYPLLRDIVQGNLDDEGFKRALLTIGAYAWHLSEHFKSMDHILKEL